MAALCLWTTAAIGAAEGRETAGEEYEQETTKPLKVRYCEADANSVYTASAELKKAKGKVTFRITVGSDGRVKEVSQEGPKAGYGLDENIQDYFERCRFVADPNLSAGETRSFIMTFHYGPGKGKNYFRHSSRDSCTVSDFFLLRSDCF